jgi:tetratricopeptide (TPR) repeat protein
MKIPDLDDSLGHEALIDRIQNWYDELCFRRISLKPGNAKYRSKLGQMAKQMQLLVEATDRWCREPADTWCRAASRDMYGQCLQTLGRDEEALEQFIQAVELAAYNAHLHESLIEQLLKLGRIAAAASAINRMSLRLIASENESTAIHILNWLIEYPELAPQIAARTIKHCVLLIAKYPPYDPSQQYRIASVPRANEK